MRTNLISTVHFRLTQSGNQFWVRAHDRFTEPLAVRIRPTDADYLKSLSTKPASESERALSTFDMACIGDFGCGVFQSKKE